MNVGSFGGILVNWLVLTSSFSIGVDTGILLTMEAILVSLIFFSAHVTVTVVVLLSVSAQTQGAISVAKVGHLQMSGFSRVGTTVPSAHFAPFDDPVPL